MAAIYWITRLDGVHTLFEIVLGLSIAALGMCLLWNFIGTEEEKVPSKIFKQIILPLIIASTLVVVFLPTKQDALLIFGLGKTIEYIESNDKAKELPDKAVDALDAWIDSINKEKDK